LQKVNVDASTFELPAGYEVMDLRQMMAPMAAAMDSAKKECAKLSEAERAQSPMCGGGAQADTAKAPAAKDALKSGLKGLFKKKP
ncbi:MAG: hypothetical protein MUE41_16240, partial [Gemmatimonadaceae bacterium]|nr:hypothetical protein [Gemmatimonadaceae bacterium]